MAIASITQLIPLHTDADGVIRVSGTRVTLDSLYAAFADGATAEEISQQYPVLNLADVYSVLGYCLRHSTEVQAYLEQRRTQAAAVRQQNEIRFDPAGVRERLLARQVQDDRHPFTNPHPTIDLNPVDLPLSIGRSTRVRTSVEDRLEQIADQLMAYPQ